MKSIPPLSFENFYATVNSIPGFLPVLIRYICILPSRKCRIPNGSRYRKSILIRITQVPCGSFGHTILTSNSTSFTVLYYRFFSVPSLIPLELPVKSLKPKIKSPTLPFRNTQNKIFWMNPTSCLKPDKPPVPFFVFLVRLTITSPGLLCVDTEPGDLHSSSLAQDPFKVLSQVP